jgi:hypothetical protein
MIEDDPPTAGSDGRAAIVLEENEARATQARAQGHLCIHGDATTEEAPHTAGVTRPHAYGGALASLTVGSHYCTSDTCIC